MIDEKAIMLLVRDGQVDKLALLFERYKVKLYNFFRRLGNTEAHSEDLVQETFMRVLAYRTSFNGDSQFNTWLYSIARNTSVDFHRKHKHADKHDEFDEEHINTSANTYSKSMTDDYCANEQQALFDKALSAIEPQHREIIVLSRFAQLRYEQIAELVDCNLNTLKSRMTLAMSKLKQTYQQLSGDASDDACKENV